LGAFVLLATPALAQTDDPGTLVLPPLSVPTRQVLPETSKSAPAATRQALPETGKSVPAAPATQPALPETGKSAGPAAVDVDNARPSFFDDALAQGNGRGFLTGDQGFQSFIGFMSNLEQNIDPRAVTEVWPVFGSSWLSTSSFLPSGNLQVYGAGLYLALSERLSIGMNQGGYVVSEFERTGLLGRQISSSHDGWVNLGGFIQYTLIRNVENQFLLTGGTRWEAPTGESSVFQGHGPAYLSPYLTGGKALGNFHILATFGYEFPTGPGTATSSTFYTNVHLDRQMFGWFYPLIEFNGSYHTTQVNFSDLDNRPGFFDFGTFSATGNIVTMAPGFNAVIVPNRLEFGAVYTTVIASQRNFDMNGLLVKMVLRY